MVSARNFKWLIAQERHFLKTGFIAALSLVLENCQYWRSAGRRQIGSRSVKSTCRLIDSHLGREGFVAVKYSEI